MEVAVVGAGSIARAYVKVLEKLGVDTIVIGRGQFNVDTMGQEFPSIKAVSGGLDKWLENNQAPKYAIVATPIDNLATNTMRLLENGCKYILAEKPLTYSENESREIAARAKKNEAKVFVAFNRRNYTSVLKGNEIIESDGGVKSFHFDFTEAIFRIDETKFSEESQKFWGIANSSHVIDTAFYLCGFPKSMESRVYGNAVKWHPSGSIYTGLGETMEEVPFTYHANWGCPGKWNLEIMTEKRRLFYSPMERLHEQPLNSFKKEFVELDYSLDIEFKPGFYRQVQELLSAESREAINLFNLEDLEGELAMHNQIFSY